MYTVSQKNDTDVAHYNFNAHQPILVIFGRDVAKTACYQMVICYPTSGETIIRKLCLFSHIMYRKRYCFGLLYLWYH